MSIMIWKDKELPKIGEVIKAVMEIKTREVAREFKKAYKEAHPETYISNLKAMFNRMDQTECDRLMHLFGLSNTSAASTLDSGGASEAPATTPAVPVVKKESAPKPSVVKPSVVKPEATKIPKEEVTVKKTIEEAPKKTAEKNVHAGDTKSHKGCECKNCKKIRAARAAEKAKDAEAATPPAKPAKKKGSKLACSVCGSEFDGKEEGFTEDEHGIVACEDCVDSATEKAEKGLTPKELKKGVSQEKVVEQLELAKKKAKKGGAVAKPAKKGKSAERECEECGEDFAPGDNTYTVEEEGVDACSACVALSVAALEAETKGKKKTGKAEKVVETKPTKKPAKKAKDEDEDDVELPDDEDDDTVKPPKKRNVAKVEKDEDEGFDHDALTEEYKGALVRIKETKEKGTVRKVSTRNGKLIIRLEDGSESKVEPDEVKVLKAPEAKPEKVAKTPRTPKATKKTSKASSDAEGLTIELDGATLDKITNGAIRAAKRSMKTMKIKRGVSPESVFAELAIENARTGLEVALGKAFAKAATEAGISSKFYAEAITAEKRAMRKAE